RRLLWGGYGHRTEAEAYKMVSALTNAPVVKLRLINPTFYHLDTCFCPIDEDTVVVYLDPFDSEGQALIRHFFKDVIEVSVREAYNFACNAAVLGKDVFLQKGSPDLEKELLKRGLNPISVDTSEFMKSGGSVFCLKMFIY
ncbi:MAG TPA: arginine deiminase-related protein, partial [Candidatus Obscuribacterales bacterium]